MTITMEKEEYDKMLQRDEKAKHLIENNSIEIIEQVVVLGFSGALKKKTNIKSINEAVEIVIKHFTKTIEEERQTYKTLLKQYEEKISTLEKQRFRFFGW